MINRHRAEVKDIIYTKRDRSGSWLAEMIAAQDPSVGPTDMMGLYAHD